MIFGRRRFDEVVTRQLDLFEREQAELVRRCDEAETAYDEAGRDEAEERYGDLLELVDEGAEALFDLRDGYARTLEGDVARDYERAFDRAVSRRLPRFAAALRAWGE